MTIVELHSLDQRRVTVYMEFHFIVASSLLQTIWHQAHYSL